MNLPIKNCRGQAYDGESNLQGNFKDVATRVQRGTFCYSCSLLGALFESLAKASPKRSQLFDEVRSMSDSGETPNLRKLCPTRRTMRTASFDSVIKNYTILLDTLQEISEGNDVHATRAGGLLSLMKKFSTFFGLKLSFLLCIRAPCKAWTYQLKMHSKQPQ